MPDSNEYNPNILGFMEERGPVIVPLQQARKVRGRLPSEYNFVTRKKGRKPKKGLNLVIGKVITEILKKPRANLKKTVYTFFQSWHRNYNQEFGVNIAAFFNLNDPSGLDDIFAVNHSLFRDLLRFDLRTELAGRKLVRKDILNSIEDKALLVTAERMLQRKLKDFRREHRHDKVTELKTLIARIHARKMIERITPYMSIDPDTDENDMRTVYADEIAAVLYALAGYVPLKGIDHLDVKKGHGVEFEFATRDYSYLALGKITGDCTADKSGFQADRDIENIYWTVFPWILDRNYQILKVYYNSVFVMKVHLLPLFVLREDGSGDMVLAVDAIETVRAIRDDIEGTGCAALLEKKTHLFRMLTKKIKEIGTRMGIDYIYAEKFSNTRWVRDELDAFPEIFLHVDSIIKLDELEDVFMLARQLCRAAGEAAPHEIFMELQMKNTALLPKLSERVAGVKPFAILQGRPEIGIQMKRVIGV